ncbi:MAG: M20/M25/M40 family metallo-hydrolase [Planctomycetia bacterium]|nr:M20/M25/M40 family metallo-hydrolase [Planctomycetia bacterium]
MDAISKFVSDNESLFHSELCEMLRFKSISADPTCFDECVKMADWLVAHFLNMGIRAETFDVPGKHPVVFAQTPRILDAPTLLIYGHYDVQPVDTGTSEGEKTNGTADAEVSEKSWRTDPFEPVFKDGLLYARGASDDKGPVFAHIAAAKYWMQAESRPQINVKFFLEGDEEGGNEEVRQFVRDHTDLLSCDYLVLSDTAQFAPGQPSLSCGLRGLAAYELTIHGPNRDLHSGTFGGAVTNPCNALVNLLSALVDEDGRVLVPGFYDEVARLSPEEARQLQILPFDESSFYANLGVASGVGEKDFSVYERLRTRPTFDIHGISAGYQGEGSKTVIPSEASAKFSFRLVPHQSPEKITESLRARLASLLPPGVRMTLDVHSEAKGVAIDTSLPCMKAAARAVEYGFGRSPLFVREGGAVPIVTTFKEALTPNIMLLALSLQTDNIHGPNEHFTMADFYRGIKTAAKLWQELAALDLL